MSMLQKAITIAVEAHAGQVDKGNKPYILHPMRVMLSGQTEDEMIVGVLHDVVEDTSVTLHDLHEAGFSDRVVAAVDGVTRRDDETYAGFIDRVITYGPLAIRVKLNDIRDNMSTSRMRPLTDSDAIGMFKRYIPAYRRLTIALEEYVTMEVHVDYAKNTNA